MWVHGVVQVTPVCVAPAESNAGIHMPTCSSVVWMLDVEKAWHTKPVATQSSLQLQRALYFVADDVSTFCGSANLDVGVRF
jgi:hypothetical protein